MLIRTGHGVLLEFVCKWDTHLLLELRICVVPILESDAMYGLNRISPLQPPSP